MLKIKSREDFESYIQIQIDDTEKILSEYVNDFDKGVRSHDVPTAFDKILDIIKWNFKDMLFYTEKHGVYTTLLAKLRANRNEPFKNIFGDLEKYVNGLIYSSKIKNSKMVDVYLLSSLESMEKIRAYITILEELFNDEVKILISNK